MKNQKVTFVRFISNNKKMLALYILLFLRGITASNNPLLGLLVIGLMLGAPLTLIFYYIYKRETDTTGRSQRDFWHYINHAGKFKIPRGTVYLFILIPFFAGSWLWTGIIFTVCTATLIFFHKKWQKSLSKNQH